MGDQVRVILWCVPRSCSTAFTKAISQLKNVKCAIMTSEEELLTEMREDSSRPSVSGDIPNNTDPTYATDELNFETWAENVGLNTKSRKLLAAQDCNSFAVLSTLDDDSVAAMKHKLTTEQAFVLTMELNKLQSKSAPVTPTVVGELPPAPTNSNSGRPEMISPAARLARVVYEPFNEAYYKGSDRVSSRFSHIPPQASLSFDVVRDSLEDDFKEYSTVFVKDLACYIRHKLDKWRAFLPKGYQHTFLIRDPTKTVSSFYRVVAGGKSDFDYFDPDEVEFQSLHDLFFLLKEETGETPILVDADDLLSNPAGMLELFCARTGLPYSESMLRWEEGDIASRTTVYPGWPNTLIRSRGFLQTSSSVGFEMKEMPKAVMECIEDNMEYYKKLYQYRITC